MKKLFGMGAAAALLAGASLIGGLGGASHAFAANCPATTPGNSTDNCSVAATVTLNQGSLTIQAPSLNAFGAVTLNGQNQTTTATWTSNSGPSSNGTFRIVDATGTGNGWNVVAQAPAFSCTYNSSTNPRCPAGGDTFPTSELNGGAFVSASCAAYTEQHCGTGRGALPVTDTASGGFIDTASGSQEFHAPANTGMGEYDVTLGTLSLVVPADAYAATYTTTITYTLASGPGSS
jgi:hypothetical protein